MNTLDTFSTTVNTATRRAAWREISHRFASIGLAAVMTVSILGSINLLAGEPAADGLLAQRGTLLANAGAKAPASSPQV